MVPHGSLVTRECLPENHDYPRLPGDQDSTWLLWVEESLSKRSCISKSVLYTCRTITPHGSSGTREFTEGSRPTYGTLNTIKVWWHYATLFEIYYFLTFIHTIQSHSVHSSPFAEARLLQ
jgi:hypothetical protein